MVSGSYHREMKGKGDEGREQWRGLGPSRHWVTLEWHRG